jgi:hypothetical protein
VDAADEVQHAEHEEHAAAGRVQPLRDDAGHLRRARG